MKGKPVKTQFLTVVTGLALMAAGMSAQTGTIAKDGAITISNGPIVTQRGKPQPAYFQKSPRGER